MQATAPSRRWVHLLVSLWRVPIAAPGKSIPLADTGFCLDVQYFPGDIFGLASHE